MNRIIKIALALMLAVTMLLPGVAMAAPAQKAGGDGTGDDYGNSFSDAFIWESNKAAGVLTTGDIDFFKFIPEYTADYTFFTAGTTNTRGYLYNAAQHLIKVKSTGGAASNFSLTASLVSGKTYYIAIGGETPTSHGNYTLVMNHSSVARGNTTGNIVNFANAAIKGNWIYYSNTGNQGKLYKVLTNGAGKTKLTNDKASCINVVGGYVYYANGSNGEKLYRIKTNGTGKQKLVNFFCTDVTVVGDWVYFISGLNNCAYKVRINGTKLTKLTNDEVKFLNVYGDKLYFCNATQGNKIYSTSLIGSNLTQLNNEQSAFLIAADGKLYYESLDSGCSIYRISTSGANRALVTADNCLNMNYSNGWLYYVNDGQMGKIYRVKANGTAKQKLNNDSCQALSIVGNYIYYYNNVAGRLYRMTTSGTGRKAVN